MSDVSDAQLDPLVACTDVELGFRGRLVVRGAALDIRPGEVWLLVGPNGCGKTTLLRALLGLVRPTRGAIVRGAALEGGRRVGYVPQWSDRDLGLPLTTREVVELGAVGAGLDRGEATTRIARVLERCGLAEHARRGFAALSGGQRQRALVARALVRRPRLLALDEPFTGLDGPGQEDLMALLLDLAREEEGALLIVSHDLAAAARHATHVGLFAGGGLAAGPAGDMLREARLAEVYGRKVALERVDGRVVAVRFEAQRDSPEHASRRSAVEARP